MLVSCASTIFTQIKTSLLKPPSPDLSPRFRSKYDYPSRLPSLLLIADIFWTVLPLATDLSKMFMPKKSRIAIYSYLFQGSLQAPRPYDATCRIASARTSLFIFVAVRTDVASC